MSTLAVLDKKVPSTPSRGGRPTREEQKKRHDLLLDVALDIFLEKGFEQTTVDEIVGTIGMSKRTVYARYKDKLTLFQAALQRAVEDYTVPYAEVAALVRDDDLFGTLNDIALLRIRNATMPAAMRLQRILTAQSHRLPDITRSGITEGTKPTISLVTELIRRHAPAGSEAAEQPSRAAFAFMSIAAGGPVRLSLLGHVLDQNEIKEGVAFNVRLFMRGIGLGVTSRYQNGPSLQE